MNKTLVFSILAITMLVISCVPPTAKEEIVVPKIDLNGKTAEEVLDMFLFYFNYNGIDERLKNLIIEQQMAEGFQLESLKTSEDYFRELKSLNDEWIKVCVEAKEARGEDLCGEVGVYGPWGKIKRSFEILSKQKIEEKDTSIKIKVNYKMNFQNTANKAQEGTGITTGQTTYFLKNYGGVWKVYDGIDETGKLFSSVSLQQEEIDNQQKIEEQRDAINEIKRLANQIKEVKDKINTNTQQTEPPILKNKRVIETKDYTATLKIEKEKDYCAESYIDQKWCSDYYGPRIDVISFTVHVSPKRPDISGGPGMVLYIFNENGDLIKTIRTGFGGTLSNWQDGWSSFYSYSANNFREDLPKTEKLFLVYGEVTRINGESLEELMALPVDGTLASINTPNIFIINYTEIEHLLEE